MASREHWRGRPIDERQRYMANEMHIHHPAFVRAIGEIRRRMRRCVNEDTGSAILFLVPSGAGKTHLIRFLKKHWPDEHSDTLTKIKVISFDVPTNPTARSMGEALLRSLGTFGGAKTGSSSSILDQITHLIPQIGTEIILIDNLHDVSEKRRAKGILEIGGWIRHLVDEGRRLVVLLGTPAASEIIASNSQLRRRTAKQLEMDYFHLGDDLSKRLYLRFINEVDTKLPLAEFSDLVKTDLAESIYHATYGIQDYIFQLMIEAVGIAVNCKREKLERSDFESAFALIFQDSAKGINPFFENAERRPLDRKGEPFFSWFDSSNPSLRR